MSYDSTPETLEHIRRVQMNMGYVQHKMFARAMNHDKEKLSPEEKAVFDEFTPRLKDSTYGSEEYKGFLKAMAPALEHHYKHSSHHPEHYEDGVSGMTLLDLFEMFCDWKAATERHANGSLEKSIKINKDRFGMSDQLAAIFENTRKEMGW